MWVRVRLGNYWKLILIKIVFFIINKIYGVYIYVFIWIYGKLVIIEYGKCSN